MASQVQIRPEPADHYPCYPNVMPNSEFCKRLVRTSTFAPCSRRFGEKYGQMPACLCLVLLGLFWSGCAARPETPIDIGSRRQLLVDEFLIERTGGTVELRLNSPVEREVVFTHDRPWEGGYSGYNTLFRDGDGYRMVYRAAAWPGIGKEPTLSVCLAESRDGIHWVRPELGLVEFQGSKKNNIILSGEISNTFVPFKDTNPAARPEERYKALAALSDPRGLYAFASPDGIRWRKISDAPVITRGKFDSQNVAFWDSERRRYRAYHREMRGPNDEIRPQGPQLGLDPDGPARDVLTSTSPDFLNWSEPRWLQYPGAPRQQLYLNQIRPYYRAPQLLLGFPGRFMAGREIEKGLPITEHPSYRYGSISETLFMSSRDGLSFKRWGEAFIRPGPRRERWIYPASFPAYGLLVTPAETADRPDELSLYVNDGGYWTANGKASRLRRYTLRIDGFVSARAGLSGGELVTRPLVFQGRELTMNYATSAAGSLQVEIQDAGGRAVPGFSLAESPEIFGDRIDGPLAWKGRADLGSLAGKPIRLRVVLKDADLYSFRFGSP